MKLNLRDSPDLSELFSVYTFKTFHRILGEPSLDIEHPWTQVINVKMTVVLATYEPYTREEHPIQPF